MKGNAKAIRTDRPEPAEKVDVEEFAMVVASGEKLLLWGWSVTGCCGPIIVRLMTMDFQVYTG